MYYVIYTEDGKQKKSDPFTSRAFALKSADWMNLFGMSAHVEDENGNVITV